MTITPLSALAMLPAGTNLECIEVQLTKVDDAPSAFGQGTKQGSFATDAGGAKATIQWIDFEPLTREWCGPWVQIISHKNGKGDFTGIEVDEYNSKKRIRIRGADQHGNPRVTINWLDAIPTAPAPAAAQPARQGPPAHRTDIEYDHQRPQQPARPPMGPPPRQAGPPSRPASPIQQAMSPPPAQPRPPAGPHGATVGMAVKEAFTALVKGVRPEAITDEVRNRVFWQDVHQCASEILHVCKALESGDIAPSIVTASLPDYPAEEAAAQDEPWPQD